MSYLGFELSIFGGAPVELYLFQLGLKYWSFTTGQTVQNYLGRDYQPIGFGRSQIENGQEFGKARLTLETIQDFEPAQEFIAGTPDGVMNLTLFRKHRGDADIAVYWKGRVVAVTFANAKAKLTCEPVFTSLRRAGLRATYQTPCRHLLYGPGCLAAMESFRASATLTGVNGISLQSQAFLSLGDGWLSAGKLVRGLTQRMIMTHAGETITLTEPIIGLAAGETVDVYPGCDHSLAACQGKFNNLANYGGFPWIPVKNPFTGDAIY